MPKTYKWGIIGPGKIARKFSEDLAVVENAELFAVASRSLSKAKEFADDFNIKFYYGSYEELVSNTEVDIIYVATPHVFHYEHTMLCLLHRKAVLCEKPFAMSHLQVKEMIATARKENVFLMEAMWTQFLPHFNFLLELINTKKYGDIKNIKADFGFEAPFLPEKRLYNKSLGGGSLMDIGIYPVFFALSLLGKPDVVLADCTLSETGVDETCKIELRYDKGVTAGLYSSIKETIPTIAEVEFETAFVLVKNRFHEPTSILIMPKDEELGEKEITFNVSTRGYNYEAEHVQKMLSENRVESTVMTFQKSLDLITLLDTIRRRINLHYE